MDKKQAVAIEIALQTQVLKTCPVHRELFFDDDVDPAGAFALAIELVRKRQTYVEDFRNDEHELTDLLSQTLATTPACCPQCESSMGLSSLPEGGRLSESALESG
jgi:hypothetical protein